MCHIIVQGMLAGRAHAAPKAQPPGALGTLPSSFSDVEAQLHHEWLSFGWIQQSRIVSVPHAAPAGLTGVKLSHCSFQVGSAHGATPSAFPSSWLSTEMQLGAGGTNPAPLQREKHPLGKHISMDHLSQHPGGLSPPMQGLQDEARCCAKAFPVLTPSC